MTLIPAAIVSLSAIVPCLARADSDATVALPPNALDHEVVLQPLETLR